MPSASFRAGMTTESFMALGGPGALAGGVDELLHRGAQVVSVLPLGVVRLEVADVADPPDVVAGAGVVGDREVEPSAGDLLSEGNSLEHRAARVARAPDVVDGAGRGPAVEAPERAH